MATTPVERPGCRNIVADRYWRLYFDPAVVEQWSQAEIIGKILFEISHLLRGHYKRFARQLGFDPAKVKERPEGIEEKRKIWTESARLELVDDFDEEGLKLPDGIRRADDWNVPTRLLVEHYFARLQKHGGQGGGQGGSSGKGKGKGQGGGKSKSQSQQQQGQQSQQLGQQGQQQQDEQQAHDPEIDGSAADGCPREWEEPAPAGLEDAEANGGQASQIPGLSDDEAELVRRSVAQKVQEHSKSRGRVPAGMKRWADEVAQPKLDYRRIVLQKVKRAIQSVRGYRDYSYRRPSRRDPGNGVINPALVDHTLNLAIVIDSSGSMSNSQLGEAVKIVSGVLKALPRRDGIRVIAADAAVYETQRIFDASHIELQGNGGTDMTLAVVSASNLKPRPDLVLLITDGFTDYPKEPTNDVPCVAIIVSQGEARGVPSWIDYVQVPHVREEVDES